MPIIKHNQNTYCGLGANIEVDASIIEGSDNAVSGGAVYEAIENIDNSLVTKQDVSTAITTSNIGSQSVNYANSAGSANTATTANSANAVAWSNVSDKPSTYTPASHTHSYMPMQSANAKIVGGSMTVTPQSSPLGGQSYVGKTAMPFISFATINSLLGVNNASPSNTTIVATNGNANAFDSHMYCGQYYSAYDNNTYAYITSTKEFEAVTIRINYIIYYFG